MTEHTKLLPLEVQNLLDIEIRMYLCAVNSLDFVFKYTEIGSFTAPRFKSLYHLENTCKLYKMEKWE